MQIETLKDFFPWTIVPTLLGDRRKQLQDWDADPPHALGWHVFFFALLEWVVAKRLFFNIGFGWDFVTEWLGVAIGILLAEFLVVKITTNVGAWFNKAGSGKTTLTFLNLGLFPLLLVLPINLILWIGGGDSYAPLRDVFNLLLFLKVFSNWKESVEISYELNQWQSALVIYLAAIFLLFVGSIFLYITLAQSIGMLAGLLNS
ncbi:MAG: hypothetical protein LHV69_11465 [Elusimicrobia bacterium]|nr:hypothetical protein [Candidatus Obscuribacterium magneticum]